MALRVMLCILPCQTSLKGYRLDLPRSNKLAEPLCTYARALILMFHYRLIQSLFMKFVSRQLLTLSLISTSGNKISDHRQIVWEPSASDAGFQPEKEVGREFLALSLLSQFSSVLRTGRIVFPAAARIVKS